MIIIIPARYASSRLPAKLLLPLGDKPVLQWTYESACQSSAERVIIATDDHRIADLARSLGAEYYLTSSEHRSGTERIAELVQKMGWTDQIIVNLQGDEPLLPPALIDQVADCLAQEKEAETATLATPLLKDELNDPHVVKLVFDHQNYALYFSRAPIPYPRQEPSAHYRHIGLYAYRADFIRRYVRWSPCALEKIESLEQLRILYYGSKIKIGLTSQRPPIGLDTPQDLAILQRLIQSKSIHAG